MPLGGINAGWDETVPADAENAGLGASRIRSLETTVQQVLDSEHNFPASGGANTGYHRLGSARPFYAQQSFVSSSGTDGRLFVASDTSRFYHVGSGGTMLLGGHTGVLHTDTTVPQTAAWIEDSGASYVTNTAGVTVTFTHPFDGAPYTQASVGTDNVAVVLFAVTIRNLTNTGFLAVPMQVVAASVTTASNVTVHWRSVGTRTFNLGYDR